MLPCLILADLVKRAGLDCTVYRAGSLRLKDLVASNGDIDWIVSGTASQALGLRNAAQSLQLDLDGKKAIVAMETGDCDAAVDAAFCALKTSGKASSGVFLVVQDSLLEDVTWRVKDRLKSARIGSALDAATDFADGQQFQAPKQVLDYLQSTRLDVSRFYFHPASRHSIISNGLVFSGGAGGKRSSDIQRSALVTYCSVGANGSNSSHHVLPDCAGIGDSAE